MGVPVCYARTPHVALINIHHLTCLRFFFFFWVKTFNPPLSANINYTQSRATHASRHAQRQVLSSLVSEPKVGAFLPASSHFPRDHCPPVSLSLTLSLFPGFERNRVMNNPQEPSRRPLRADTEAGGAHWFHQVRNQQQAGP